MAIFTNTEDASGILPDDYGTLIVRPVEKASDAFGVSTLHTTAAHAYQIPVVTDDGGAGWFGEGDDMSTADGTFTEVTVTPAKVGGVREISRELRDDSSPDAQEEVGRMVARAIASEVDRAFFAPYVPATAPAVNPAPKGLEEVEGVTEVDAGTTWSNVDWAADAISMAEIEGAELTAFVTSPTDFRALLKLKREDGSNEPLLGHDATAPTVRTVHGVPVIANKHVTPGTLWGIPREFVHTVMREDVTIETSEHAKFANDIVLVKALMRVGFAFSHPAAIVKVTLSDAETETEDGTEGTEA